MARQKNFKAIRKAIKYKHIDDFRAVEHKVKTPDGDIIRFQIFNLGKAKYKLAKKSFRAFMDGFKNKVEAKDETKTN